MTLQPTAMIESYVTRAARAVDDDEIVSVIQETISSDVIYHMGELLYEPQVQKVRCWWWRFFLFCSVVTLKTKKKKPD